MGYSIAGGDDHTRHLSERRRKPVKPACAPGAAAPPRLNRSVGASYECFRSQTGLPARRA